MTRDEAHFKLREGTRSSCTESFMVDLLDSLESLGILKLDEPKGPNERAVDAMFECGAVITPRHAVLAIEAAGLKIVEK